MQEEPVSKFTVHKNQQDEVENMGEECVWE